VIHIIYNLLKILDRDVTSQSNDLQRDFHCCFWCSPNSL